MTSPESPLTLFRLVLGLPLFFAGLAGLWSDFPLPGLVALLCALYLSFRPASVTATLRIPYWEGLGVLLVVLVVMVYRASQM